jgi:hypothetical protein
MIVLVLVVVWVLALTPYALRKLGEWQVSSEVNRFHRGLGALGAFFSGSEQAPDARFLLADGRFLPAGGHPGASGTEEAAYGSARPEGSEEGAGPTLDEPVVARHPTPAGSGYRPSHQLVMRRRRVLGWLGASLGGSFLFGAIPWFRALWDLSLVVLVISVLYVGALVYVQRQAVLAAERAAKIVRLRAIRSPTPLDRSAAAPAVVALSAAGAMAAAGGGGGIGVSRIIPFRPSERPVVVALPRRPSFVLVDAPS